MSIPLRERGETRFPDAFVAHVGSGVPVGPGIPPMRLGLQQQHWQVGGPSGFKDGTAGHVNPWPYITHFINFLTPGPYGTANSAAAPRPWPYATGASSFNPVGMRKPQTFTRFYF